MSNKRATPGFQVRDRDVTICAQLFAKSLPDLLPHRCCQLSQTVSGLTEITQRVKNERF